MDERKKNEAKTRKMNTFANRSLPVQLSLAKLFTFRWQFTEEDNSQGSFAGLTANVPEAVDLSESIKTVNLKSSITR